MRYSPSYWARLRCRVEDGKVRVGSEAHLALLDHEVAIRGLTPRTRKIFYLATQGWSHQLIADQLGLSRSRVTHLIRDAEESINSGSGE